MIPLNRVTLGDALETLKGMPSASVHCVVTSVPYWALRSYLPGSDPNKAKEMGNEPTIQEFVSNLVTVFREVRRVLHPTGSLFLNIGDSYCGTGAGQKNLGKNSNPAESWPQTRPNPSDSGLKPKDLACAPWRLNLALQDDGWWFRCDIIWYQCLSGGTILYVKTDNTTGPRSVKDIAKLDPKNVKLWNGTEWVSLVSIHKTEVESKLKITLRSGEKINCSGDHRWPTDRGLVEAKDLIVGDILKSSALPDESTSCIFDDHKFGYFVGAFIADGSFSGDTIQISSGSRNIDKRRSVFTDVSEDLGGTCRIHKVDENCWTVSVRGIAKALIDQFVSGKGAYKKHLSSKCWKMSNLFLKGLLIGYLEGDGHYDIKNRRWRIGFCENHLLAKSLRTLCSRLKADLRIKRVVRPDGYIQYRGQIRTVESNHYNSKSSQEIVSIDPSNSRQFWDIEVDKDPHLFALASGVLTHNSNKKPEPSRGRCGITHEYIFHLTPSARCYWDPEPTRVRNGKEASLAEYEAALGSNQGADADRYGKGFRKNSTPITHPSGALLRSVWRIPTRASLLKDHFASFPPELPRRCILMATSAAGCCPTCLNPWQRIVEKGKPDLEAQRRMGGDASGEYHGTATREFPDGIQDSSALKDRILRGTTSRVTLGWEPTCECPPHEPMPCRVLDPFAGCGTTLAVARELGRDAIGIDLNPSYVEGANRILDMVEQGLPVFEAAKFHREQTEKQQMNLFES